MVSQSLSSQDANPFFRALRALEKSRQRVVIVGGFAVVMQGVSRFTPDINICVDFEESSLRQILKELAEWGYSSDELHEDKDRLGDADFRSELVHTTGKRFISFSDVQAPTFRIDILLENPIPFRPLLEGADQISIGDLSCHIASVDQLITMKQQCGRPQDKSDIENLLLIKELVAVSSVEEFINRSEGSFDKERRTSLAEFYRLPLEERMDWLKDMLAQLGQFCVV